VQKNRQYPLGNEGVSIHQSNRRYHQPTKPRLELPMAATATRQEVTSRVTYRYVHLYKLTLPYYSICTMARGLASCSKGPKSDHNRILFRGATARIGPLPTHYWGFTITLRQKKLVELLWMSDQPNAKISTWHTRHSQETNIHDPGGIRTHNPRIQAATVPRLRPRGHWDRHNRKYHS
jgi:hypothetical protein